MMVIPNNAIGFKIKSLQATTSTLLRGGRGNMGTPTPMQPEESLVLYEFEACPYSRRVREVMTHLNLDYESCPSPHRGHVYRDELKKLSGKKQVPFLVDENTDDKILDSQAIIDHLFAHYSKKGSTPDKYQQPSDEDNATLINKAASVASMMRGVKAAHPKKNKARGKPDEPLHLYGFEASPFCRLVREKLSTLEVGYINHNVAREQIEDIGVFGKRLNLGEYEPIKGGKRERIMNEEMNGKLQFPYLIDPNTDTEMFESQDIIDYLVKTYG
ncbi:glutathione S-transferase N-terminal domain-containing protein [Psychrobacter frigidicola]|uniref:glutathione S-transferase N-terminal domain-containing protein n=1 Tax=Psychrobacter frigidicola TaxID=45611 RepID=UPI001D129A35|nr:glutathione S-transferase N-terminal domain-containing protein [Psychrobacter frigidicola]